METGFVSGISETSPRLPGCSLGQQDAEGLQRRCGREYGFDPLLPHLGADEARSNIHIVLAAFVRVNPLQLDWPSARSANGMGGGGVLIDLALLHIP